MTYQDQLSPWVVYKLLPALQNSPVARFRYRNDAESYLKLVSRVMPQTTFMVSFDGPTRAVDKAPKAEAVEKAPKKARTSRKKATVA
ncbi:MAG: hypothetical protein Fur0046_29400 [Cyanobacteria bacterium J069]|nr:MAG: hypothetical protein D6742_02715 [Cyanobacteria bacterium J069]